MVVSCIECVAVMCTRMILRELGSDSSDWGVKYICSEVVISKEGMGDDIVWW